MTLRGVDLSGSTLARINLMAGGCTVGIGISALFSWSRIRYELLTGARREMQRLVEWLNQGRPPQEDDQQESVPAVYSDSQRPADWYMEPSPKISFAQGVLWTLICCSSSIVVHLTAWSIEYVVPLVERVQGVQISESAVQGLALGGAALVAAVGLRWLQRQAPRTSACLSIVAGVSVAWEAHSRIWKAQGEWTVELGMALVAVAYFLRDALVGLKSTEKGCGSSTS